MKKTLLLILILILLVGCKEKTKLDKDYTTDEMVPELNSNGYKTVPVDEVTKKIGSVAAAVGAAVPESTTKALSGVASFVGCMQNKGAWSSKAYYHQDEIAFGLVASASMKESTDAMNLGYCAVQSFVLSRMVQMSIIGPFEPQLCRWGVETPNDTLYNVMIVSHRGMFDEICKNIPGGCRGCSNIMRKKST